MLVLTRKPEEGIRFPNLGITVRVTQIQGKKVRLAIDAPPHIEILRSEILSQAKASRSNKFLSHEMRNRLNELGLALQLFQRQQETGLTEESHRTAHKILTTLGQLNKEYAEPKADSPSCGRTLVVEDNPNERELLADLLKLNGYEVFTAADGCEALEQLATGIRPDFVLLDMRMPRCDGVQTIRSIRSNPQTHDLPILAMSGSSLDEFEIQQGPEGFDGWLPKPLNTEQLWERVQRALEGSRN